VSRVVANTNGLVDKYVGEVAMAVWNAVVPRPMHAREACIAAVVCLRQVTALQRRTHTRSLAS
jgi:adenylate cyclase